VELDYRHRVLAVAVVANVAQFGARLAFSPVVPDAVEAFTITKSTVGLLLSGVWVAFALVQFPSGVLADRYGERRVILAAMAGTVLPSLGLAFAPSFAWFVVAAIALGAGAGLYFSVGTALLSGLFEERNTALGIHTAGVPVAGLVLPGVVTAIALRYHWQDAFLVTAGIAALAFVLVVAGIDRTEPADPGRSLREAVRVSLLRRLLVRREVAVTLALAVLGMFAFQALVSFYPTFLEEYWNYSETRASGLFSVLFVLFAISLFVQGRLADAVSRDGVLVAAYLLAAAGFAVGVSKAVPGAPLLSVGLIGMGVGWAGVIQARFMAGFDATERGTGFGLVRTVFVTLGSAGNAVTGALAESVDWTAAYGLVSVLLVIAAIVVVLDNVTRSYSTT
jgi:MFS family permease